MSASAPTRKPALRVAVVGASASATTVRQLLDFCAPQWEDGGAFVYSRTPRRERGAQRRTAVMVTGPTPAASSCVTMCACTREMR